MPITISTGGNGFLGATVLNQLLAKDHTVIAAVRVLPRIDTRDAEKVFRIKWQTLDETMKDTAESLLSLEGKA